MEPFSIHPGSCSCTSCVYRSRSKAPNIQQFLQEGTDIDKLYLGKFLPLRERKLLEKLIRTRDVYDGVRNQLLSASEQTIPKHKKKRRDEDLSSEQSSAVLQMVGLVDRGQMGTAHGLKAKLSSCCSSCSCRSLRKGTKRHEKEDKKHRKVHGHMDTSEDIAMHNANRAKVRSSCCSCCSCETLMKIRKRMEKEDKKHPKVHRQIVTCEDIAKYCEIAAEKGRKRRRKLSTKISKLSSRIGGAARLKIKKNLSEPTVMSKSKEFMKRIRSKRKAIDSSTKIATKDQTTKTAKGQKRKVKKIQSRSSKGSASVLGTIAAKIKKDSLILFKEKLLKKRPYDKNKEVECKPGTCKAGTCSPEECIKKIKSKGTGDTRRRRHHNRHAETGRDKKIRPKTVKVSESQVQVAKYKSTSSLTTILKTKDMPSLSRTELHGKIPASPKPVKGKDGKALAKSATSMTSIPKFKAKAQLTTKEEKIAPKLKSKAKRRPVAKYIEHEKDSEENNPVEVMTKSKFTTKHATKSTSSLISVPKERAAKTRTKRIKTYERYEGEPASPPTRYKTGRQKPRRIPRQHIEETDIQEPIEYVKTKKEKRMKPTHGMKQRQKYRHSRTQFTSALAKVSKHSHLRDSASQASKPHGRKIKILTKSKSQGKSAIASMERLKRKSVGSAAFSQKTSSRSRTKSKHKQSKSAENFTKKSKYISKEPPPEIEENNIECYPNRQAVKISSSFSFDIEFYKDTNPCVGVYEQPDIESPQTPRPRTKIKQTQHRRKYRDHGTGHKLSRHNMSSQSDSTQSFKSTQIAHKLKRCFCTQKLIQTKKHKLNYVESKKTMASLDTRERDVVARQIRTQTKHSGNAYVVSPSTSTQASLLPYECEPDFCTPGECDPYKCLERIKQRNRRAGKPVSRDTNTTVSPKKSKFASTSPSESKSTSSKVQSDENKKIKQKRRHTQNEGGHHYSSKIEPKVSSDGPGQRQAVRISSSFNFSVEFSKTHINDRVTANALIYDRPIRREGPHTRPKGIKVYKPSIRHETSETTRNVKTKQTHTEPFLQRCLCTLKLLKKNKKKVEKLSPWRNRDEYVMHMQNRAENRYNPERLKCLPYGCEPGSCIPKEYHPYDCEKFIKLRQHKLKHKYSNIHDLESETTTSSESQNAQVFTKEFRQKVNKINQHHNEMKIMPDRFKRRVMRGVSNNSSKIEFSKEKSVHYKKNDNFITTEDYINVHTQNKYKLNTRGSQNVEHSTHHTSKETRPKLIEKGSSVLSVIKKCFSILKLPRKSNKLELEKKNNVISESTKTSHHFPKSQICEYKNIRARSSKFSYHLSNHERFPNFSIPEMSTPYDRHVENKRRDIIRLDKPHASNRSKRKSAMSITTDFYGNTKAKSSQSRFLKHRTREDQKLRNKQRGMKAARSFSPSRLVQCEGSNSSFNKKKSKNRFMPSTRSTTIKNRFEKYNTISDISTINGMKDQYCISQENKYAKERKPSNIGFLLKKCFCRLGLQKKNIPEREFHWQKPITTQYVQVKYNKEINRHSVQKSRCNFLKTLNTKEPLHSKLPEGRYIIKENHIKSQNGMKNNSQHLPNSSFSRRGHIRSQIDVDFSKLKNLLNIQKINPFYQSFYALNVKVSRSRDLQDMDSRVKMKGSKSAGSKKQEDRPCKDVADPAKPDCYQRCKAEFEGKKDKPKPSGPDKPLILGSDFKINAAVYKDTDPYKDGRRQALRLGSDARFNIDFFKQPTRRNVCYTGPIPWRTLPKERQMMKGSAEVLQRLSRQEQLKNENQQKPSGVKLMMKRFSRSTAKLKRAARRSDLSQELDATSMYRAPPKYKSTPRLSRRERRERRESTKLREFPCRECVLRQQKIRRKSTERNNVTFCTDVNCLEYAKEEAVQKHRTSFTSRIMGRGGDQVKSMTKTNRIRQYGTERERDRMEQGKGEGDVEKQLGPTERRKSMKDKNFPKNIKNKCKCNENPVEKPIAKTKTKERALCFCKFGNKLEPETKRGKMRHWEPGEAERQMETIMPYSKKKFKQLESQAKLNPPPEEEKKRRRARDRKRQKDGEKEKPKIPDYDVRVTPSFECVCNKEARLRRLCPVCRAKAQGKFTKKKNKLPCTCAEEEIVPEKPKDLSKCPMCKETIKKKKPNAKISKCPCCKHPFSLKDAPGAAAAPAVVEKPVDNSPKFEMLLNTTNMKIVNKDEVLKKIGQSSKEAHDKKAKALKKALGHGSKCKCCICSGVEKGKHHAKTPIAMKPETIEKPCICGSVVCKKDWDKIKQEQRSLAVVASRLKKCICGSPICAEESSKRPEALLEEARQEEHVKELQKRARVKEKLYQKARLQRAKEQEKDRKVEDKLRKKQDKAEMKSIKKNVTAGDVTMIAESLIDLGTFGSKAFCDVAKTIFRGALHPRDAITDMQDMSSDPKARRKRLQRYFAQMGLFATGQRIQSRFVKMPTAKRIVKQLESYPTSNYIIHMADKDPRKRMKKFTISKRKREPVEFECSLFMSSMRKRPWLKVYYMCPWFYPHCISLLGLWRQFLDVLLFILAAAVWSPCIMCMELCRGFVCCVLCQG